MLCLPSTNSIKSSVFTRHKELEKAKEKPRNKKKKQSFDVLASTKLAFRSRSLPIRINQERGSSRLRGRETGLSGRCRGGHIVFCCWTTRTTKKTQESRLQGYVVDFKFIARFPQQRVRAGLWVCGPPESEASTRNPNVSQSQPENR
ncbi:hypothetical protein BDL97_01G055100 [Sphagnum fallax]|nr:hypothetical protein BDL97_01G055100 [Sphagnum fallax]